jgi:hypothetical protein
VWTCSVFIDWYSKPPWLKIVPLGVPIIGYYDPDVRSGSLVDNEGFVVKRIGVELRQALQIMAKHSQKAKNTDWARATGDLSHVIVG